MYISIHIYAYIYIYVFLTHHTHPHLGLNAFNSKYLQAATKDRLQEKRTRCLAPPKWLHKQVCSLTSQPRSRTAADCLFHSWALIIGIREMQRVPSKQNEPMMSRSKLPKLGGIALSGSASLKRNRNMNCIRSYPTRRVVWSLVLWRCSGGVNFLTHNQIIQINPNQFRPWKAPATGSCDQRERGCT